MFKIFAAFRRLFAIDRTFKALSAIVGDAINKLIIPALQKMSDNTEVIDEKVKLEALMGEYREYADPRSSKNEEFAVIAERVITTFMRKYSRGQQEADDVAQQIASNFYSKTTWMESFESPRFDARRGPVELKHYWSNIIYRQSAKEFEKLVKDFPVADMGTDDSGNYDPYRNMSAPKEMSISQMEQQEQEEDEMYYGLIKYVNEHSRQYGSGSGSEWVPEVSKRWMELALKEGGVNGRNVEVDGVNFKVEGIDFKNDIEIPLQKSLKSRGKKIPSGSTINNAINIFRKLSKEYFRKVLKHRMTDRVKQRLQISSEDRIASDVFRVKLARWVLSV